MIFRIHVVSNILQNTLAKGNRENVSKGRKILLQKVKSHSTYMCMYVYIFFLYIFYVILSQLQHSHLHKTIRRVSCGGINKCLEELAT